MPIQEPLRPVLAAWRLKSGGEGLLFRPAIPARGGRPDHPPTFVQVHTLHRALKDALAELRAPRDGGAPLPLPSLTWYQATRHTFASLWVLAGGSIEKLSKVMGHSSIVTTERYAHLRPDLFAAADYRLLAVDLAPRGDLVPLRAENGAVGYALVTPAGEGQAKSAITV